ncbi:MAG: cutinase family protein [Actinomycetia bacterium]|nr:cutinase family protein [Actinomycetes bacterium]MCH9700679.1 cutinase family protein [Actinomycetes bacterium]MCH9760820.1 cutinase family protein [Actinomycetes bacterium]
MLALAAVAASSALLGVAVPARAVSCPDVGIIFARGTGEPPGIGRVGQAFAEALSPLLDGRSLATYPVDYPASVNFLTTARGAYDAKDQIDTLSEQCPATRLVLGGFSQGAAVMSMLAGVAPVGSRIGNMGSAPPLPPKSTGKVAAVAVFGNPAVRFGTPLSTSGLFVGRAIDLCSDGDPICTSGGRDRQAHNNYDMPPYNEEAAAFVAALL